MEEIPLYQRPSFRITILAVVLAGLYAYTIIEYGPSFRNLAGIVFDGLLLVLLVRIAVFFYAQFTLPVRTFSDRLKLSSRLWLHRRRAHGAAIFVRNGREISRPGEIEQEGPGLIWVDTASAVVTWSGLGRKDVLGPGIHFTDATQKIGRTFSLHTQVCQLGPGLDDPVFQRTTEPISAEQRQKLSSVQANRTAVSGRTRDGNEVVPNILITFRLESEPASGLAPGTRFGFSAQSVERASRAEGINADLDLGQQARVAWNQMPGLIAIDLWREYLSKFTLDELFKPVFPSLPSVPQPTEPPPPIDVPSSPLILKRGLIARLLRQRNNAFENWLARKGIGAAAPGAPEHSAETPHSAPGASGGPYTALQIIAQMIKARMTQAAVPVLDECGRLLEGHQLSPEFSKLRERGLEVTDVSLNHVRFDPAVEAQIVQLWNTDWLANAETERQQVEQLERLAAQSGRQRALLERAFALGRAVQQEKPADVSSALSVLLRVTEAQIVSDQALYARGVGEAQTVSNLIRWVESGEHE